jgi:protein-disulfide isomerase
MRTFGLLAGAAALVLSLAAPSPARCQPVPWDKLPGVDASVLTDTVKERATALMGALSSYAVCSRTVLACAGEPGASPLVLRMAGFIVRQAAKGKSDDDVRKAFQERAVSAKPFKTAALDMTGVPCVGAATPAVTVVAFSDFDCPFCKLVSPALKRLALKHADKVAFCFKTFPVKGHGEQAVETAKAGIAARDLGTFWEFHDAMYESFDKHSASQVESLASRLGMDLSRFRSIRDSGAAKDAVAASKREGLKLGVKSTPAIYVNGKLYQSEKTEQELEDRILEELEMLGR